VVVRRWLSLGLIPEPPWTRQQLHQVRDATDPQGRRRGPNVPHGTLTRWLEGCDCDRCREAQNDAAKARFRRKAQERLPPDVWVSRSLGGSRLPTRAVPCHAMSVRRPFVSWGWKATPHPRCFVACRASALALALSSQMSPAGRHVLVVRRADSLPWRISLASSLQSPASAGENGDHVVSQLGRTEHLPRGDAPSQSASNGLARQDQHRRLPTERDLSGGLSDRGRGPVRGGYARGPRRRGRRRAAGSTSPLRSGAGRCYRAGRRAGAARPERCCGDR
jgi:hypothetical protein